MNRISRIAIACGAVAITAMGGLAAALPASAASGGPHACTGGTWQTPTMLGSGSYDGLTVSGVCMVTPGSTITVDGPVTIGTAGTLFALQSQTMTITGNISVGRAAILALGCPTDSCTGAKGAPAPSKDTVNGNITATGALSMYLDADTINGNVKFTWGGWGPMCTDPNTNDPKDPLGHDLIIKDNSVKGSVTVYGWSGCFLGVMRNTVTGNLHLTDNYANPGNVIKATGHQVPNQGLDSTAVDANHVQGRLTCHGNTPAAQYGSAAHSPANKGGPNTVGRYASGECKDLTHL